MIRGFQGPELSNNKTPVESMPVILAWDHFDCASSLVAIGTTRRGGWQTPEIGRGSARAGQCPFTPSDRGHVKGR
jgi:hypothetical protein